MKCTPKVLCLTFRVHFIFGMNGFLSAEEGGVSACQTDRKCPLTRLHTDWNDKLGKDCYFINKHRKSNHYCHSVFFQHREYAFCYIFNKTCLPYLYFLSLKCNLKLQNINKMFVSIKNKMLFCKLKKKIKLNLIYIYYNLTFSS